ncbi:Delta(8)-fatty-acid desaturase [Symbiodinium microadriaticum]|uniref:Delta(8)-fatty-acid desaturase n=1 Tax=Symbiodinium microadriaticum TaxID=2951 RepID=A0A1Q9CIR3_SYMMI|nr:Delta(8)-fatty-acid desaturase [Symbiodinium microadriaticum]CAE7031014.1 sld1 [Symbiodinium sp. KB8]
METREQQHQTRVAAPSEEFQMGQTGSAASVAAVACGILLAGRLSLESLMYMGFISMSGKTALTLAALASLSYVICGPLLLQARLTKRIGQMLVDRVLNARCNWESDTLRSFCEVSLWLMVVWSTYVSSEGGPIGLVAALTFGTCAGAVLAVLGELLQQPLRSVERVLRESSARRTRLKTAEEEEETFVTSNIVMLVLFGPTVVSTVYDNCSDMAVLAGILVLGGATILAAARVCQAWEPTRHLGNILQARILNTSENWREHPGRSALESTFFCAVVMGVYELHGDALFALQTGFMSGMSIVIASEVFAHGINFDIKVDDSKQTSVPPVILGYVSFMVLVCFYAREHETVNSAALSVIFNSLLWVILGRCCSAVEAGQHLGQIVNRRALDAAENWTKFPVRSAVECSAWLFGQYIGHRCGSVFASAVIGTAVGIVAVSFSEVTAWHSKKLRRAPQAKKLRGNTIKGKWTWDEVYKHSSPEDAWIVIDGRVLDVTDFAPRHPGGPIILTYAGVDATDQFAAFHRPRVYARLAQFHVGEVVGDKSLPTKATEEYRALRKKLWEEGWFEPRLPYFAFKAVVCLLLLTFVIGVLTYLSPVWILTRTFVAGAAMGIAWQQIAFLAHDADHWGITSPPSGSSFNPLSWFLASVLFGISRSMWNEEHSMHHAITLRPQEDPQFNYLPLWLISKKELDVAGTHVGFLTRMLVSVQHWTFLPVSVVIGRFNFYLISMLSALKRAVTAKNSRELCGGLLDVMGMVLFWTWYVALVCNLDTAAERTLFVLASNWTVGILHIQLVLSHLATETFTAEEERVEQFFAFQLKTSRNIDSSWYDHWFHGGLEFQIEHHLFPQLPRHNLSKVKPMVQEICSRHGIPYRSTSFSQALRDVLSDFRGLAMDIVNLKMG